MAIRPPPADFLEGLRARQVVVIAGAGVTAATVPQAPIATWSGLLRAFVDEHPADDDEQRRAHKITLTRLEYPNAEELINAASDLRAAWGQDAFYSWIGDQFRRLNDKERRPGVIEAIGDFDCPILTTNFDTLIEHALTRQWQVLEDVELGVGIIDNSYRDVLHIHGCHMKPSGLVIDAAGYERVLAHQSAQDLLTNLASKTLLFIGCGSTVADPNIGSLYKLLTRLSQFDARVQHFRLVRALDGRAEGRVVTNVVYGDRFEDLEEFLRSITEAVTRRPAAQGLPTVAAHSATDDAPPTDLRVQISGAQVSISCAATDVTESFTCTPDWARTTTMRQLEAALHPTPPAPDTSERERLSTAQLLGNHLMMTYGTALAKALRALPHDGRCRLVLDIQDGDARRWPWECLHSRNVIPEIEPPFGFVADALEFSVVRLSTAGRRPSLPKRENKPLKVLLAIGDPHDRIKAGDLPERVQALGKDVVGVQPPDEKRVTTTTIKQALKTWSQQDQRPVDVLHIVAEVRMGDSGLMIELDDDDAIDLVQFHGSLTNFHPPRLVVLQLQPAPGTPSGVVMDAAYAASSSGVPNLVAVHHDAAHASTTEHLGAMYVALKEGQRLDRALQDARRRYQVEQETDSASFPALLLELDSEDVFATEVEQEPTPTPFKPDLLQTTAPADRRSETTRLDEVAQVPESAARSGFETRKPRTLRPETSRPPIAERNPTPYVDGVEGVP